jgi:hypothetical protein
MLLRRARWVKTAGAAATSSRKELLFPSIVTASSGLLNGTGASVTKGSIESSKVSVIGSNLRKIDSSKRKPSRDGAYAITVFLPSLQCSETSGPHDPPRSLSDYIFTSFAFRSSAPKQSRRSSCAGLARYKNHQEIIVRVRTRRDAGVEAPATEHLTTIGIIRDSR